VARDDAVVAIHQHRVRPAVLDDAGGDLGHLIVSVRARIAGVGNQRRDLAVLDVEVVQNQFLKKKTRRRKSVGGLGMCADWRARANRKPCKPWFAVGR
jgi:hypothetical protein